MHRTASVRGLGAVLLIAGLAGCEDHPSASVVGAHITELTTEKVGVSLDVKIENPWVFPLPLAEAKGSLFSAQINATAPFLQVAGGSTAPVPRAGSLTVPLRGTLTYWPLPSNLANLHPGDEVPYQAKLKLALQTPPNQRLDLPELTYHGKIPILAPPQVSIKSVSWPTFSWERVSGTVTLGITNMNRFSIGPGSASGELILRKQAFMSDDKELASLSAGMPGMIAGHHTGDLGITVSFKPEDLFDLGTWAGLVVALVDNHQFRARGKISAQTSYIPVELKFDSQ
ncbi:MAG TPA: hypothetical protein VGW35_08065 [Methylomirabilota bacterium]|jgi:hypothetical protein|nr:hypothetical protein [Methylomirabilota bacterium]